MSVVDIVLNNSIKHASFITSRHLKVIAVIVGSSENPHVLCIDKCVLPPLQGRGDITGGCKCGVKGVKCTPRCGNCH